MEHIVSIDSVTLENARKMQTDLVEATYFKGCCAECAKFRGRWFSISGRDKRFPKVPTYRCNCQGLSFYPTIFGLSSPVCCGKNQIIAFSNRPFVDDRTNEELQIYQKYLSDSGKPFVASKTVSAPIGMTNPQTLRDTQVVNQSVQPNSKKPWYKRWWIWVMLGLTTQIILMSGAFFLSQYQDNEALASRKHWADSAELKNYTEISHNELYSNAQKYVGEDILTAVRISDITRNGEGNLRTNVDDGSIVFYDLDFVFANSNELISYEKGDYVVVIGKVKEKTVFLRTVVIENCHIIDKGDSAKEKMKELSR